MQMVTRQAPVSRGRLAVPQAPRDCPNDIIDLIHDCTTFAPVRHLPIYTSEFYLLPPQQKSAEDAH